MRIKEGFMLRSLGGQDIVVPIGSASRKFHGMIKLNKTGAFLWSEIKNGKTRKELIQSMTEHYQVSEEQAENGIQEFLKSLEGVGCIIDDEYYL